MTSPPDEGGGVVAPLRDSLRLDVDEEERTVTLYVVRAQGVKGQDNNCIALIFVRKLTSSHSNDPIWIVLSPLWYDKNAIFQRKK